MRILLDTSAFLWAILDDPRLSEPVRTTIEDETNDVWVSAASFWEITIKYGLGNLPLPDEPDPYLMQQRTAAGFDFLPIGELDVCQVHRLPAIHRDPFDRLLVAQANFHDMVIATSDPMIAQYPVQLIW